MKKNIFVVGMDSFNLEKLEKSAGRRRMCIPFSY